MSDNNDKIKKPEESIFRKSFKRAIGGGISGSLAMLIQVSSLMWLRTIMNHQYRYGEKMIPVTKKLYAEGGVRRFYRGYSFAIMLGPLSRFGDTASNSYVLELLKDSKLPTSVKTMCGSTSAAMFRVLVMPLDALKTTLQVEGKNGMSLLRNKVKANGFGVLYYGTVAAMSATFVGHYPWFLVYNVLSERIPQQKEKIKKLLRSAFIGFNSAVVSDTCSNSLRVIKTTRQTYSEKISYKEVVRTIVEKDGVLALFGRGLKTRILTNGLQGIIFTVVWNYAKELWFKEKF